MINIRGFAKDSMDDFGIENTQDYIAVNCCGYQKFITTNLSIARNKGRNDYQIIYIKKGKYLCKIADKEKIIPKGHILIFTPNEPQYYSYSYKDSPEVYWIHFSGPPGNT